jgi:hypothetical protein
MSEHWTVYCESCGVYGPDIRWSSHVQLVGLWPRYHGMEKIRRDELYAKDAQARWKEFLEEHGWHRIRLVHE